MTGDYQPELLLTAAGGGLCASHLLWSLFDKPDTVGTLGAGLVIGSLLLRTYKRIRRHTDRGRTPQ